MERLQASAGSAYSALEAAIHLARYAPILPMCKGRRVLDLACGEGYGSWLMAQAGAISVDGVDRSEEAVKSAVGTFQHPNINFETACGTTLAQNRAPGSYDLIVCIETIEHVAEPQELLKQIDMLMAQDCIVYLTCPNDNWYYSDNTSNPFHEKKYNFPEFQHLSENILGSASRWMIGTAALGFTTVPINTGRHRPSPSMYVDAQPLLSTLLCPPAIDDVIGPSSSSYFVGIWNDPSNDISGGAVFPMSMTRYAQKEDALSQLRQIQDAAAVASAREGSLVSTELKALRDAVLTRSEGSDELAAVRQQNAALATGLQELQGRFSSDLAAAQSRLSDQSIDAERRIREAVAQLENERFVHGIALREREAALHEAIRADREATVASCHETVALARTEAAAAEARLSGETRARAAAESERDIALQQAAETLKLRSTLQSVRIQAAALRAENDALGRSTARLRTRVHELEAQATIRDEEARRAKESADRRVSEEMVQLQQTFQAVRVQAAALRAENDTLGRSTARLRTRVHELEAQAAIRDEEARRAEESADRRVSEEMVQLQQTLQAVRVQAAALRAENDVLGRSVSLLKADVQSHLARHRSDEEVIRKYRLAKDKASEDARLRRDAIDTAHTVRTELLADEIRAFEMCLAKIGQLVAKANGFYHRRMLQSIRQILVAHEAERPLGGLWPPDPSNDGVRRRLIEVSPLFDQDAYLALHPDVGAAQLDPVLHYLHYGDNERRATASRFDASAYHAANLDIAPAGENALIHFILYGARELRPLDPSGEIEPSH